ncbi:MAG: zeta toxin family protein [Saprospiraceae bacterium]|nr:zeta toxin family protein [Saprospiraceae bacterium]MBK6817838.1 zeta toxin family protein [Saprospiraceae bacterium]MBK7370698.1 zeta toxin family protein [Saprospiraceae bacterium]MBK7436756.1 zeta toxin family protein [Saprospiraceae bacterium]MBK7608217.1 zeta toxin family protein [Saprospiraceae bacterium]
MKKRRPFLIGITGGSGSGKTSFIKELRSKYNNQQVCIISQDDFYHPRQHQKKDEQGVVNFDLPTSLDLKKFANSVKDLTLGHTINLEEYTFNNKKIKPKILTFYSAPIIIVEGLFVFSVPMIRKMLDLKIYIEAKENLKVIRRIKRDQIERNYPLEDVLYRYEKHVLPAFERYILPHKDEVDIIVNNNDSFKPALAMISGYIDHLLSS